MSGVASAHRRPNSLAMSPTPKFGLASFTLGRASLENQKNADLKNERQNRMNMIINYIWHKIRLLALIENIINVGYKVKVNFFVTFCISILHPVACFTVTKFKIIDK